MSDSTTLPQLYGSFPISSSQNVFKQSSTAWLAINFILFIAYTIAKIIANRKSQYGAGVSFSNFILRHTLCFL